MPRLARYSRHPMTRCTDTDDSSAILKVLAHDLPSPARALRQYKMLLDMVDGFELPEEAAKWFGRIDDSLDRMDRLHVALAELSAAARSGVRGSEPVEVWPIAEAIASDLAVTLRTTGKSPRSPATGDVLTTIFSHLLQNIVDHAGDGAQAELSIARGVVILKDNGRGIDARLQDQIFLPFRPVAPHDSPHRGMGLPLVSRLCRALGGSVVVDLPDTGGVEVRLQLPMVSDE
ncbi:MAG: signal transduction histidine kinase [Myxococcota bacterium]|jgi:signal transduction histidine kinase